MLVAIDAGTGTVAWRAGGGDALADGYAGRRTGAQVVYTPPGLYSAGAKFVTVAGQHITARDTGTGGTLWSVPAPGAPRCLGATFTTTGGQLLTHDKCTRTLARLDLSSGKMLDPVPAEAVEPVSCRVGFSECAAMRVTAAGTVTGWLLTGATPVELAPLAAPGSLYDGRHVVVPGAGSSSLSAVDDGGRVLWTWRPAAPAPFRLLAADRGRVVLLESDSTLVSLDAATGRFKSYASALMKHEPQRPYDVNRWYVSGSYVVLERTNPDAPSNARDEAYYYTNRPILIASAGVPE